MPDLIQLALYVAVNRSGFSRRPSGLSFARSPGPAGWAFAAQGGDMEERPAFDLLAQATRTSSPGA